MRQNSHQNLSYSQKKRAKLNYRKVYFQHNPGLFVFGFVLTVTGLLLGKKMLK